MAAILRYPGVYIQEQSSLLHSVSDLPTAVPAFIGYTEKASINEESVLNIPTKIRSFAEYVSVFGVGFNSKFDILDPLPNGSGILIKVKSGKKVVDYVPNHKAYMFPSIKLFYDNGGKDCYIVSVGTYGDASSVTVEADDLLGTKIVNGNILEGGLNAIENYVEPTIIVIPDAVNLPSVQCYQVYQRMLSHCFKMENRFAVLDIHNGFQKQIARQAPTDVITHFRGQIGTENLKFGAVYYPWLESIIDRSEPTFQDINLQLNELNQLLPENRANAIIDEHLKLNDITADINHNLHLELLSVSLTYKAIIKAIKVLNNRIPPSGAIAGIYVTTDNSRGVWKAPAGVSVNSVIQPTVQLSRVEQELLNIDAVSGKSINTINYYTGRGTLVWGARTLAGNSNEYRYVSVHRTILHIKNYIKTGLIPFVFETNDTNTWVAVKNMISNYLIVLWLNGAFAGSQPEKAYFVQVGLGQTMTAQDIIEGKMIISVGVSIIRPAEFIVFQITQKMQES
ncbi:phage tail sheath C-terminal domain-containing protein [Algibacter sp. AS12]|uniref:phage tail sheath family protein n=1 Tax=Algibacter sp. AS12 TaxID=3135773 RepID=UPI00398B9797